MIDSMQPLWVDLWPGNWVLTQLTRGAQWHHPSYKQTNHHFFHHFCRSLALLRVRRDRCRTLPGCTAYKIPLVFFKSNNRLWSSTIHWWSRQMLMAKTAIISLVRHLAFTRKTAAEAASQLWRGGGARQCCLFTEKVCMKESAASPDLPLKCWAPSH